MADKWICQSCGEKISDGVPKGSKVKAVDWGGKCPLCGGPLKPIKKK